MAPLSLVSFLLHWREEFGHRPQVKDEGWGCSVAAAPGEEAKVTHTHPHLYPEAAWPSGYVEETGSSSLNINILSAAKAAVGTSWSAAESSVSLVSPAA